MIVELKKMLLSNPKAIENILTKYDFHNIDVSSKEIRCGVSDKNNRTSVRIKLQNNDNLFVNDYGRGTNCDLFSYIIKIKKVEFTNVINTIKKELGIENSYIFTKRKSIFGGFYDNIKSHRNNDINMITYDEDILNDYINAFSLRFFKDNISLEAQKFFNIRFDIESQRIVFPIRNWMGNIIGIKGRANWDVEDEPKYLFLIPCKVSNTLFGYSHNYEFLTENKIIICESEKSCMQAYTYGHRNVIALGGNSISSQQCKLIMGLNPTEVIFALDEGLDINVTTTNINKLKSYTKMSDVKIKYWQYENSRYIKNGSKNSITDMGKEIFEKIIREEIV